MLAVDYFREHAPQKPYSTDDLFDGIKPRKKTEALKRRYIQPNGPTHKRWFCFDIDRQGGGIDFDFRGAPTPNLSVINTQNKHAHLLYLLETPVRTAPDGSLKALRYAESTERGLLAVLSADIGYSGLIVKNLLHGFWDTIKWHSEAYSLDELADYVDLSAKPANQETFGLGRNCALFEQLRPYAYKLAREENPDFENKVIDRAFDINANFGMSGMDFREVQQIAKSVIKWTSKRFDKETFSAIQAARGRKGGKVSKRPVSAHSERTQKPWEALGISRPTYYRRKKTGEI